MRTSSAVFILITFFLTAVTTEALADREKIVIPTPTGSVKTFKFKSSKGDVTFDHDLHVREMKNDACLPCHRVQSPTPEYVSSRFEERTAHSFCRGCHRQKGKGPTECHECHHSKKVK
jgi:hypothetical protein